MKRNGERCDTKISCAVGRAGPDRTKQVNSGTMAVSHASHTSTKAPAADLSYLLHENPNRLQSFEPSFGNSLPDAEDAVQEALLRAWRYRDSLKEGAPMRPWLYRVATNSCLESMSVVWFPASSETFQ